MPVELNLSPSRLKSAGSSVEKRTQTHGKFDGLIFPRIIYIKYIICNVTYRTLDYTWKLPLSAKQMLHFEGN
jgi:hypothetical protein